MAYAQGHSARGAAPSAAPAGMRFAQQRNTASSMPSSPGGGRSSQMAAHSQQQQWQQPPQHTYERDPTLYDFAPAHAQPQWSSQNRQSRPPPPPPPAARYDHYPPPPPPAAKSNGGGGRSTAAGYHSSQNHNGGGSYSNGYGYGSSSNGSGPRSQSAVQPNHSRDYYSHQRSHEGEHKYSSPSPPPSKIPYAHHHAPPQPQHYNYSSPQHASQHHHPSSHHSPSYAQHPPPPLQHSPERHYQQPPERQPYQHYLSPQRPHTEQRYHGSIAEEHYATDGGGGGGGHYDHYRKREQFASSPSSPVDHHHDPHAAPQLSKSPWSLVDLHRRHGPERAERPKPSMAFAVQQALNMHPHAVSGFLVMNQYNAKRGAEQAAAAARGGDRGYAPDDGRPLPIFAFSRPAPTHGVGAATALVLKGGNSIARVLARAHDIKVAHEGGYPGSPHGAVSPTSPSAYPRAREAMGPEQMAALFAFSPKRAQQQPVTQQGIHLSQQRSNAHSGGYHSDYSPSPRAADPAAPERPSYSPPKPFTLLSPVPKTAPRALVSTRPAQPAPAPALSPTAADQAAQADRSARQKLEADLALASTDAERRRLERRHRDEVEARDYQHELETRKAARIQQDALATAQAEADRSFQRGVQEGAETARRRAEAEDAERKRAALLAPKPAPAAAGAAGAASVAPVDLFAELEAKRKKREAAEAAAAAEIEAELRRKRAERKKQAEEEERLAEEAAKKRREEKRLRAEAAEAEERKRLEALKKPPPGYAAPTKQSQTRAEAAAAVVAPGIAQEREERRRKAEQAEAARLDEEAAAERRARKERREKAEAEERRVEEEAAEKRRVARREAMERERLADEAAIARRKQASLELDASDSAQKAWKQAEDDDALRRKKAAEDEERRKASQARLDALMPAAPQDSSDDDDDSPSKLQKKRAVQDGAAAGTLVSGSEYPQEPSATTSRIGTARASQGALAISVSTPGKSPGSGAPVSSLTLATLEATRDELRTIKSFLAVPSSSLLPRLQTTGLIADLTEKELLLLLTAGRVRGSPVDGPSRTLAVLDQLQKHPSGSLCYLSVMDLARDIAEVVHHRAPTFGIEFRADSEHGRHCILKSHLSRVYASWIEPKDRDTLFDYLASPDCTLFATNVKLSNRTLDSLLTEAGTTEAAIALCRSFCAKSLQFVTAPELLDALRAQRLWKAGNVLAAFATSDRTMIAFLGADARPDPDPTAFGASPPVPAPIPSVGPLSLSVSGGGGASSGDSHSPKSSSGSGATDASITTPKSKSKNAAFQPPAWITAADRDRLFEYLASADCTLFSTNVKLSNRTLNLFLSECGSCDKTLGMLMLFNVQGRQFPSAPSLLQALKLAASEEAQFLGLPEPAAAGSSAAVVVLTPSPRPSDVVPAQASADSLIPNMPAPSAIPLPLTPTPVVGSPAPLILPPGVVPPPVRAAWITEKERDELFAFLSDPDCALFSVNVKLSNRTLDAFLTEGGSLLDTVGFLKQLNDAGNQYGSTTELLEAVKLMRIQREADIKTARSQLTARQAAAAESSHSIPNHALALKAEAIKHEEETKAKEEAQARAKQQQQEKEKNEAAAAAAAAAAATAAAAVVTTTTVAPAPAAKAAFTHRTAPWITPADRDQLFDYLASVDCLLFAVNVKLSNKALDSILVEGGSAANAVGLVVALNAANLQFNTVGELIEGMHAWKTKGQAQRTAAVAAAGPPSPVKQPTPRSTPPKATPPATAAAVSPPAPVVPAPVAAPVVASSPANDRDQLFDLLADVDCQLFSQDVKLNNKSLDRLLAAGTSFALTAMYCREFHQSHLQFSSVDDLVGAITATHQAAAEHKQQLFQYIRANQAHLLTADALQDAEALTQDHVNALYLDGHSGLYTLLHVERVQSLNDRSSSLDALAAQIRKVDAAMNAQHVKDTKAVAAFLSTPSAAQLWVGEPPEISSVEHIHLAASGRQSLYAPSRSVEFMQKLVSAGERFDSLEDLMTALHNGISNPNTARDQPPAEGESAITARNILDRYNDYDEADMAGILQTDLAAAAAAKAAAAKGDAKASGVNSILVPQIPPLPKEAEARRHEAALARIAEDGAEESARVAANKTPRNAQLVATFRCQGLPKVDTFGSCDGYLEFYRYRAYQDQVTTAVWEQMKNNLWQKVCRTEVVADSLNPTWPTVVWQVESLCSGEYDRPILIKVFGHSRATPAGQYIGELVTTLREITERGKTVPGAKPAAAAASSSAAASVVSQVGRGFEILNESESKKNPRSYVHSGLLFVAKAEIKVARSIVAVRTIVSAIQSKVTVEPEKSGESSRSSGRSAALASAAPPKVMHQSLSRFNGHMAGMGAGQYVYSECLSWWNIKGVGLEKMELLGESDPILQVWRVNPNLATKDAAGNGYSLTNQGGGAGGGGGGGGAGAAGAPLTLPSSPSPTDYQLVYTSETKPHTLSPEWRHFVLSLKELCTGNVLAPLIVRVYSSSTSAADLIGEFSTDLYTLLTKGVSGDCSYALIHPSKASKSSYKNSGTLICKLKLLSKFDLVSRDPQLVEELVVRAPFLLGWQPGLELSSLANKKGGGGGGKHGRSKSGHPGSKNAQAKQKQEMSTNHSSRSHNH